MQPSAARQNRRRLADLQRLAKTAHYLESTDDTTPYTDIASIHTLSQYAAPVVHRGERWNWATARYFAGIVMEGKTERNPYDV